VKRLPPPNLDAAEVYQACVGEVSNADLSTRLVSVAANLLALADEYQVRAVASELHLYKASKWSNGDQIVICGLTKTQFKDLYSTYMVPATRPARIYYDQLLNSAPLGKCPLCGFGQVSTLDHFMSKACYPYFAVLPINLVPACADCNKKKASSELTEHSQSSHPYFELPEIETGTWLFASVVETSPVTATFSAMPPLHWSEKLCRRITNHFRDLELASRFSIEAASEMATLSDYLGCLGTSEKISEHLSMTANIERLNRRNTWKAALYEALSQSAWYQRGGYQRPSV
jgi:hypothetical protein